MGLLGRDTDLHLFAPPLLKPILDLMLKAADTNFGYNVHFHPLNEEGVLVDDEKFTVETFKVFHRIECWGFIFREKRKPRKIKKEAIANLHLSSGYFEKLKMGEDVTTDTGEEVLNEEVTIANAPSRSYAFCGDTLYNPVVAEKVKDVTMIYHEATYLKSLEDRAFLRFHSTTTQAAEIAVQANAQRLLIGHFSSKYEELHEFLAEANLFFLILILPLKG
jgi:ribonuclease Z